MVNIKLGFKKLIFNNLIILIKLCKIPYKNLDKAPLFSRNQVFCLKKIKLWRARTTVGFNTFCWNFASISHSSISTKGCSGIFLFCLDIELFAKIKKDLVSTLIETRFLKFLLITQDLNKIFQFFLMSSPQSSNFQTNNLVSRK